MNFCSSCGNPLAEKVPRNDDRRRHVCSDCGTVHYQNPKIVTGCLPVWENSVLLCRRAIEPRRGYWTVPAGFMELDETVQQGAIRETWEEARARVSNIDLYRVFDVPYISQIYMFYRCDLDNGEHAAGPESLETGLYDESDVPWDEIAFPVISQTLREFFSDAAAGQFPVRVSAIEYRPRR